MNPDNVSVKDMINYCEERIQGAEGANLIIQQAIINTLKSVAQLKAEQQGSSIMVEFTEADDDRIGELVRRKVGYMDRRQKSMDISEMRAVDDAIAGINLTLFRLKVRKMYSYEHRLTTISEQLKKPSLTPVEQSDLVHLHIDLQKQIEVIRKEISAL